MSDFFSLPPLALFGIMMGGIFALTGILMALMSASFHWSFVAKHRTRTELPRKIDAAEHKRAVMMNSVLSTAIFACITVVFFDVLLYAGPLVPERLCFEIASMLLLYDFLYYLTHRFVFHEWSVGQKWHRIHHRIRSPRTKDSLYIHPMETILGVAMMIISIVITGLLAATLFGGANGLHILAFGIGFFIYSVLNLFIHSALQLPFFPFNLLGPLCKHHDMHHSSMRGGYYASITPIWDMLLCTNTETVPARSKKRAGETP